MDAYGDLDMVVGEKNGTLTLFERNSLGLWSAYNSPVNGDNWGGIVVDNLLGINGYSVPALTQTEEGLRVFVANETGTVQDFGLASTDWDAVLGEVESEVFGPRDGFRAASAFADLTGDGILDAVVGIQNGGLLAYVGGSDSSSVQLDRIPSQHFPWKLMPNPGTSFLRWETAQPWSGEIRVWNAQGVLVASQQVRNEKGGEFQTDAWSAGMYVAVPVDPSNRAGGNIKGVPFGTPLTWIKLPH